MNLGTEPTPGRYLVSYRSSPGDDLFDGYTYMPTPYGATVLRI